MLINCLQCNGDGFWRLPVEDIDDRYDLTIATMIYADGKRWPAMSEEPIEKVPSGNPVAYEFPCFKCRGLGEIEMAVIGTALGLLRSSPRRLSN